MALSIAMCLEFEEKVNINHECLHVELNLMIFKSQGSSGLSNNILLSLIVLFDTFKAPIQAVNFLG